MPYEKRKFKKNANSYWTVCRGRLKRIFEEKGITTCELMLPGCAYDNFLSFAHYHKRIWYKVRGREGLLGEFNQVLLACIPCHQKIEIDKGLTKKFFDKLRPN